MVDSWGYGVGWRRGTQILDGSNQVPWSILGLVDWDGGDGGGTQILDGSMDTSWLILGLVGWGGGEEPKFWVDPTRFLGQFLGWWGGVELRNPNFGWTHGHIMVDSWGYGVGWR